LIPARTVVEDHEQREETLRRIGTRGGSKEGGEDGEEGLVGEANGAGEEDEGRIHRGLTESQHQAPVSRIAVI
jgi:hypothetical protein